MFLNVFQYPMEDIVLFSVEDSLLGPPTALYSLMLTCRRFHSMLTVGAAPRLYSQLFSHKFDAAGLLRRLHFQDSFAVHFAAELRKRFMVLNCIRKQKIDDPQLSEAFFTAYLMLLEDDGKNRAQLQRVGLQNLVLTYLQKSLHTDVELHNGWPVDNELNALAVTLFWQLSSQGLCCLMILVQ